MLLTRQNKTFQPKSVRVAQWIESLIGIKRDDKVRLLNLDIERWHDTSDDNIKIKDLLVVFELRVDVELNGGAENRNLVMRFS